MFFFIESIVGEVEKIALVSCWKLLFFEKRHTFIDSMILCIDYTRKVLIIISTGYSSLTCKMS